MSSAFHDEAHRKMRVEERKQTWLRANATETVEGEKVPFVKSIPDAQYLRELEAENKAKCKKR